MAWSSGYPDPAALKADIDAMVAALRVVFGRREYAIDAMYAKGSAFKQWDSPIDYVPDLSDVDVHLRTAATFPQDILDAMALSAEIEEEFRKLVPAPIHMPMLQLSLLHELEGESGYHPSPLGATYHLHGPEYVHGDLDLPAAQERAIEQLLQNKRFLDGKLPRMFYKEGWSLPRMLRDIAWMISPVGPHVLTLHGIPYSTAWSMNRTRIVAALKEVGEEELAQNYERFYLCGWDLFFGKDVAREGIIVGWHVLSRGVELAAARRNP